MATADASSLLAGLQRLKQAAELSPTALVEVAHDAIEDVQHNAATLLGSQQSQVGFDLEQFQTNISRPGQLILGAPGVGSIGILDTNLMGTVDDFEAIRGLGLFHQGTQDRKGVWRNIVYPDDAWRETVARLRQAIWGAKTPQWYLLENGFSGDGAFPDTPATHFVESATGPSLMVKVLSRISHVFRGV